ncbi:MAG: mannosyl-3-phosphoglycerate phosphatase, partial [Pseudomonadota bacterium]|nr:mannosyl-3-phosphoglycerate phosphatase [Pseudomonadota bacterium]
MPLIPLLVFTDLDGTLLDHHSYGYAPAQPALDALAQ